MRRVALAVLVAAAVLAVGPGAQAKLPPDGVDVCGASACVHLTTEQSTALWSGARDVAPPLRTPSPFYVLRWRWHPADVEQTAYYVPAVNALRWPGSWLVLDEISAAAFERAAAGLSPHPVIPPTAVSVGAKQARGPETYLRLLEGPAAGLAPVTTRWITVTMRSEPASPWTDGQSQIRISARGRSRLVLVDGWVHRVPLWVANRARRGLPLTR